MNNAVFWNGNNFKLVSSDNDEELYQMKSIVAKTATELNRQNLNNYKIVFSSHPIFPFELMSDWPESIIVIIQTDHLRHDSLLRHINYTHDSYSIPFLISDTLTDLVRFATDNPLKTILWYHTVYNIERELSQLVIPVNLKIQFFGTGNLAGSPIKHSNTKLLIDKNLNSTKTFICMNNINRPHRTATVAYLFGDDLIPYGHTTYIGWEQDPTVGCFLDWCFSNIHQPILDKINNGIAQFNSLLLADIPMNRKPYKNNNNLYEIYRDVFVDVITDTTFIEPCAFLNDKYINSILGANFPILIASSGTVSALRNIGFDMFDDIIDHSYDNINDHALRLQAAIKLNRNLLINVEVTKQLWLDNSVRFITNQTFYHNDFKKLAGDILENGIVEGIIQLHQN